MTITPEAQAYQNGRDDMKERILEKLQEELLYLQGMDNCDLLTKLMNHLITRVENL